MRDAAARPPGRHRWRPARCATWPRPSPPPSRLEAVLESHASRRAAPRRRRGAIDPGARASLAEAIGRCVEEDGSDLRDNASPHAAPAARRAAPRPPARGRGAAQARPLRAARAPAGGVRHRARRPARPRRQGERPREGAGDRPRRVELRPDAVRRAVRGRRARATGCREAAGAEREEVERILRDLSARVGAHAEPLRALVEAAGELDLALARGVALAPLARRRGATSATRCGCSARGTRCWIPRRRCRSTSTWAGCARSSSAARTRAARRWR